MAPGTRVRLLPMVLLYLTNLQQNRHFAAKLAVSLLHPCNLTEPLREYRRQVIYISRNFSQYHQSDTKSRQETIKAIFHLLALF